MEIRMRVPNDPQGSLSAFTRKESTKNLPLFNVLKLSPHQSGAEEE